MLSQDTSQPLRLKEGGQVTPSLVDGTRVKDRVVQSARKQPNGQRSGLPVSMSFQTYRNNQVTAASPQTQFAQSNLKTRGALAPRVGLHMQASEPDRSSMSTKRQQLYGKTYQTSYSKSDRKNQSISDGDILSPLSKKSGLSDTSKPGLRKASDTSLDPYGVSTTAKKDTARGKRCIDEEDENGASVEKTVRCQAPHSDFGAVQTLRIEESDRRESKLL